MPGPNQRVAQVVREAIETGNPNQKVAHVVREEMILTSPHHKVAHVVREIMLLSPLTNVRRSPVLFVVT